MKKRETILVLAILVCLAIVDELFQRFMGSGFLRVLFTFGLLLLARFHWERISSYFIPAGEGSDLEFANKCQVGRIVAYDGQVVLNLSTDFRYLPPIPTVKLMVTEWGFDTDEAGEPLGAIFRNEGQSITSSWCILLWTSDPDCGHITDHDAKSLFGDSFEAELSALAAAGREETKECMRWIQTPIYDPQTNWLSWTREIEIVTPPEKFCHFESRLLGKLGYVMLGAIAQPSQIAEIEESLQILKKEISFVPGHQYKDFVPGNDKMREGGVLALVRESLSIYTR